MGSFGKTERQTLNFVFLFSLNQSHEHVEFVLLEPSPVLALQSGPLSALVQIYCAIEFVSLWKHSS